jgi:AraC family transcriptional regulator of adaptative response / methylphosphotriester-DNA alkyltransferase methyltransferase
MRSQTVAARRRLYLLARVVVARHYRQELTLALVARTLASSPRQLQRAYAQFGDMSFREDLLARRMAVASELLAQQPSIAVADIARLVGYRHAPHFARAFRRRYGLSPASFRVAAAQAEERSYAARGSSASRSSESGPSTSAPGRCRHISVPPPAAASAVTLPPC